MPIVKTSKVAFASRKQHRSKYYTIWVMLGHLRQGQTMTIPVDSTASGVSARVLRNRLNAAQARSGVLPPAGCVFRKRITEDGDLAICCERK